MEQAFTKRAVAIVMACMMAIGFTFALTGCSNDEEVIRNGITAELDAFKNPTKENIEPYLSEADLTSELAMFDQYDIDIYEFFGHAYRGFDYSIGDITVNGDKATADISVTNLDVADAMSQTLAKVQNDEETATQLQQVATDEGEGGIMRYIFGLLYDALDAEEGTVTSDTQLTLTKSGNEWSVDEESLTELTSNMYGDLGNL